MRHFERCGTMIYVFLGDGGGQWDKGLEFQNTIAKSGFTVSFDYVATSPQYQTFSLNFRQ